MFKDILVNLSVTDRPDTATPFAISVCAAFDAHLTGIAFAYEPFIPGTLFEGMSASVAAGFRAESKKAANTAAEKLEKSARDAAVSAESRVIGASIEGAADIFGRLARRSDLAIVQQPDSKNYTDDLLIEGTLFGSGRPMIVVPYIHKSGLELNRVLLCWDGSRHAARAFGDALPLLQRSQNIDVITIASKDNNKGEISGADIAHHLARHRLKVDLKRIVAADVDVASTILSLAADTSADLLVMGGYGHSRLREFILGGTTRGILSAMTVPTLMSH